MSLNSQQYASSLDRFSALLEDLLTRVAVLERLMGTGTAVVQAETVPGDDTEEGTP